MNEKQVLASFISRLPQAIIACDVEGRVRLYNSQAEKHLLRNSSLTSDEVSEKDFFISSAIDKNLIEYGLDEIKAHMIHKVDSPSASFIFQHHGKSFQATMVPILDNVGLITGFVLIFEDITRQSQAEKKVEAMLNTLSKNARSPLASIRAAIEAMREFPGMDGERRDAFIEIIHNESLVLGDILNTITREYSEFVSTRKSLQTVHVTDLLQSISRRSEERVKAKLHVQPETLHQTDTIRAAPYAFTDALLFILEKLKGQTGVTDFYVYSRTENELVMIDISWEGRPVKPQLLKQWESERPGGQNSACLGEILDEHNSALWSHPGNEAGKVRPCLRLILPVAQRSELPAFEEGAAIPESRIQLSGLELFAQNERAPELDQRLLTELSYTSLIRKINRARGIEEIIGKQSQLPRIIHSMLTGGSKIRTITWLITAFADAILAKLLAFALEETGPPPVPFAFLCLGSEGRKEQTLKTDQDNAIIFQDPENESDCDRIQAFFLKLGEMVCNWLDQAGYDFCQGGVMAKNPRWCQPLSQWKKYFSAWIHAPTPETLLHTAIFFDFRFMYGNRNLAGELTEYLFKSLAGWPGFFRNMAENGVHFSPPIGLFGRFVTEKKGPGKNCLDIKMANTPLVDFARIYALKHGIAETGTQDRLYQLYVKRVLSRGEYNELDQAYTFTMQLRFMEQTRRILALNQPPSNYLDPKRLSSIEKRMLKEVLKKIKSVQEKMRVELIGLKDQQM